MFDERQLNARRRGYTASFWGLIALLGLNLVASAWLGHPLFASQYVGTLTLVFAVMTPLSCYFILASAYLKPGQGDGSLLATAALGLVWLALGAVMLWSALTLPGYGQPLLRAGRLTEGFVTTVVLPLVFTALGATSGYQWWRNRHAEAD
ncbi:hypothetical protein [Lacticaseibacillus kribbianus]|uniref:hypothetical protein n=1 Tax=Lacticaseibacillus kribbianus TaxID=2926292 RepID=UPI001CD2810A|nr:hypothetical protein [Lacticaseibacillus kribbianus]